MPHLVKKLDAATLEARSREWDAQNVEVNLNGSGVTCTRNEHQVIDIALSLFDSVSNEALLSNIDNLTNVLQRARSPIYDAVLNNDALLCKILTYDGSLAYYHKNYDDLVNWDRPLPSNWVVPDSVPYLALEQRAKPHTLHKQIYLKSRILVCKRWKDMILGKHGIDAWREEFTRTNKRHIAIAKQAINDKKLVWNARIKAMAIADDIDNLKKMYFYYDNRARLPNYDHKYGIGQALFERASYGLFLNPVPRSHPFFHLYQSLEIYVEESGRFNQWEFDINIAFAAATFGATRVLAFLKARHDKLWDALFGEDEDKNLLNILVHNACKQLPNDGLVKCIAILLSGHIFDEKSNLYKIPYNQNGNHLHHAAARGHIDLVKVLLESGMEQTANTLFRFRSSLHFKKCTYLLNST